MATVEANQQEVVQVINRSARLGLDQPYPEQEPFIWIARQSLLQSLDNGKNAQTISFEMMEKLQSHYSNLYHTLPQGIGLSTIADGKGSSTSTGSPTYSYWFKCFMTGCHRRMVDTRIQDRATALAEVLHSYIFLEEDWKKFEGDWDMHLQTALMAMILVGGFSGGL
jgi:hypothetical protein